MNSTVNKHICRVPKTSNYYKIFGCFIHFLYFWAVEYHCVFIVLLITFYFTHLKFVLNLYSEGW